MIEPSWVLASVAVISLVLSIGTGIYTWHATRNRSQAAAIANLREKFNEQDERRRLDSQRNGERITIIENEMGHLPGQSQVAAMRESINEVRGDVGGVRDMLKTLNARVERIDNYLLNKDGK